MFLNFIATGEKVINLAYVVTVEDQSEVNDADEVTRSITFIRTIGGDEILLYDDEADEVFEKVNHIVAANDAALRQLQELAIVISQANYALNAQQQGAQPQ